jgi:hypothetical protein
VGSNPASSMPMAKRTATAAAKVEHAAMSGRHAPHRTSETPRYLPMGRQVRM